MENFEKCTVAMLGGPCSQHVTGNTSRLYQPQSAIMERNTYTRDVYRIKRVTVQSYMVFNYTHQQNTYTPDY